MTARDRQLIHRIQRAVCAVGWKGQPVSRRDLLSNARPERIALPRMIGIYLARVHTRASLHEIGSAFHRHNTNCVMAHKRIAELIPIDPIIGSQVKFLETSLALSRSAPEGASALTQTGDTTKHVL